MPGTVARYPRANLKLYAFGSDNQLSFEKGDHDEEQDDQSYVDGGICDVGSETSPSRFYPTVTG